MVDIQSELHFLTIREAADLLRSQQLSPVELTRAFLDRIDATDARLHSFITLLREEALADARSAEAEILRGEYKGPLHGIPFALKHCRKKRPGLSRALRLGPLGMKRYAHILGLQIDGVQQPDIRAVQIVHRLQLRQFRRAQPQTGPFGHQFKLFRGHRPFPMVSS